MGALALFTSTEGRLAPKPFWLSVLAVYLAGLASQLLLLPPTMAHSGVWAFVFAQAILIWAWLALHIKRLRDAGLAPTGAIAVAVLYALALTLLLMMLVVLINPNPPGGRSGDEGLALLLVIVIFSLLFGVFVTFLKVIILIACLPAIIALVFSVVTGLRKSLHEKPAMKSLQ